MSFPAPTPDFWYSLTGGLIVLMTIANFLVTWFRGRNPQPFVVRGQDQFVRESSYHKHCEINRDEHARMEAETKAALKALEQDQKALSREVSERIATERIIVARLTQVDAKIDTLLARTAAGEKKS